MKIIIPARMGSKGLPFKNRKLLRYTLDMIPAKYEVALVSDDEEIQRLAVNYPNVIIMNRPAELSTDVASTKDVVSWTINKLKWSSETIIMLYLTYPQRKWEHVKSALHRFLSTDAESMLCKKEIEWTPFLVLKEEHDHKGSQLFHHDLYRRQDYPKCFEVSHYISIFRGYAINKLNNNLYNNDTIYFPIDSVIDVDEQKDLNKFLNENQ